jgi:hypothetical protein
MLLTLKRFLARFFDYGLFYFCSIFASQMTPLDVDEKFYFTFGLALPFVWAPIEAFLIKKWGTTPGKKLFGMTIPAITWKESFKRAFFLGKRERVIFRPITLWRYVVALMIACSAGSSLFYGKDLFEAPIHYEQKMTDHGWVQYTAEDGRFSVNFPKKPQNLSTTVEVPNEGPINLSEFKVEKDASFSVSYLDLPKKWKIFSSNTLLKGAMKVIHEHMPGTELLDKTIVKHKNYPAMDFKMKEGENEIEGRIILVGNTLYRLMVTYYPDTPRSQQHHTFVESFDLKKALPN